MSLSDYGYCHYCHQTAYKPTHTKQECERSQMISETLIYNLWLLNKQWNELKEIILYKLVKLVKKICTFNSRNED